MHGLWSKRRPDPQQLSCPLEDEDLITGEEDIGQTDEDKRRVRRTLRDLHDKLINRKDGEGDNFNLILMEAEQILKDVKGTQEAMEDAKMFRMLCQKVREMSEDTNTNEKQFHVDEFAANIGRIVNASIERGNIVKITRAQLVSLGKRLSNKFKRSPSFSVILGALDTEAPEEKEKRRTARRPVAERQRAVTKTAIVEKSQADGQMTDKLVASTREILNKEYKSNGKKPVNYFEFVIDPESFGNTVENMFHVSFLVKQRCVQLSVDDSIGLPVLEPVSSRARDAGDEEGGGEKNQAIITLSYEDWEEFVEVLEIKKAVIVHDEALRSAIRAKS